MDGQFCISSATLHNLTSQVLERKLQGHDLEIVLLNNFLKERLIMTAISQSSNFERYLTIVLDASDEFLALELGCTTFITHNTRILFHKAHL